MKRKILSFAIILIIFVMVLGACRRLPIPPTGLEETPTAVLDIGPFFSFLPFLSNSVIDVGGPLPTETLTPQPTSTPGEPPVIPPLPPAGDGDWATVAGNIQRTSWSSEEVGDGAMVVEWYRPIEAYIPQNVQLIASNGLIFVSTSRGLYALSAVNGQTVWRFDTELPLGNSPTVVDGTLYVGGLDHKIYALKATDGTFLWSFNEAESGFSTNPLVVDGRVFAGNRDGYFYAIGAQGTSQQGHLLWKFKTDGMIDLSAAYADGVVYFASNDNHAYALSASNGAQVWKSDLLPGDGYGSYWPVVYGNMVIFSAASGYRTGFNPGTSSLVDPDGNAYGKIFDIDRDGVFNTSPDGTFIGPEVSGQDWANGKKVLDASRLTNYLEANNHADRRTLIMLNRDDGKEFTFDSDGDGIPEYMPALMVGTQSGNRYPPIVGSDGILYFTDVIQKFYIPQGKVVGWRVGTQYLSLAGAQGAVDEPQAISAGGSKIFRNLCCDRVGDWFSLDTGRAGALWQYVTPLAIQIPGYDEMWYGTIEGDTVRLRGNYGTQNGIYHNHGDQNPIIPYQGSLYVHRSNAIIAYGPGPSYGKQPLLTINQVIDPAPSTSQLQLEQRLSNEVELMLAAGHLRPGYYNAGQFGNYSQLANYFENPGETLYTLSMAYPYLSTSLKAQLRIYLQEEFDLYFDPNMVSKIGWRDGNTREWMPLPADVQSEISNLGPSLGADPRFTWPYPPFNFYAMWKYAKIVPEDIQSAYALAKSKIIVPVPATATNDILFQRPYEHNAYIAGYYGFLQLQDLAGKSSVDSSLRTSVTNEMNRLMTLRSLTFTKDTYWVDGVGSYHLRTLNISRNFIYLVPELGDYLNQNAFAKVNEAINEYNFTAPYWFASRYNAAVNEGVRQNLYDYGAVFQAKAYIMKADRSELLKYLDVPAFARGDLFYIQNLVAALTAG